MDKCLNQDYSLYTKQRNSILIIYLIFYYAVVILFTITGRLLSQSQPVFFSHNRDLTELLIIAAGIPGYMIHHTWTFYLADILLFLLPVILSLYYLIKKKFSKPIGAVFVLFIVSYILLENIFLKVTPTMYIGLFLMGFIFITNTKTGFYTILALCKYYFLYTIFTSALWKIFRGAIFNYQEMSNILLFQHANVLSSNCQSISCRLYFYLIDNPGISYLIFLITVVVEFFFVIGFFTKKYNKLLFILAVLFFIGDVIIMRIPFWPFLLLGVPLLIRGYDGTPENAFSLKQWSSIYSKNTNTLLTYPEKSVIK